MGRGLQGIRHLFARSEKPPQRLPLFVFFERHHRHVGFDEERPLEGRLLQIFDIGRSDRQEEVVFVDGEDVRPVVLVFVGRVHVEGE
ncbi:MAG: hypothetical protein ACLFVJ_05905 [Persicimonas sp.]